ncbi:mechanosensitive ion channel domain-containing protein [Halobaculum marinum]|uniref:Mechanosensitive ion channel domain-containing protein n=1 Tax=Halobaculum marinum TaxID=3031996 RepID=A0ABD5WYM5_9EURY|nr:mechanosensitive ion channel domain-containing protein [Halobaculum sp. DT55]
MTDTLPLQSGQSLVEEALNRFVTDITAALPDVLAGVVFLVIASVGIKVVMTVLKAFLRRTVPGESPVYRQFVATVVAVFLWFGVGLSFLSIVGLEGIATSLGTAAGFLALGVSYATSSMIADAVAGVYLLRDRDFNPGDTVDIGGTEGVVQSIELRKTRLTVDDDTVVRGNAEIEKKWTKIDDVDTETTVAATADD